MRLIDADALLEKLEKTTRYFTVKFDIEDQPTVDAAPVVRCRDCIHFYTDEYGFPACAESGAMLAPEEDDYCSRGVQNPICGRAQYGTICRGRQNRRPK